MVNAKIRLKNLQLLRSKFGGTQKDFAALVGTTANTLNQMMKSHRNVGPQTARRIEKILKLSDGWMDSHHPKEWDMMVVPVYDERRPRNRAFSRIGSSFAARIEALTDERALEQISFLIELCEERQRTRQRSSLLEFKAPEPE